MNAPVADQRGREIGFLSSVLGDAIRESSGPEAYQIVEQLRRAAHSRRLGHAGADHQIKQLIAGLDDTQIRVAIRAFTVLLDLLNLVEDRHRVRVLAERAERAYPHPRQESIGSAICQLKDAGMPADDVQQLIHQLQIELVFTAHPTEAKRRSVRSKLRAIRTLMQEYGPDQRRQDRDRTEELVRAEVTKLWQTDFIRPWRPSVMQEVARGLSIKPVLWDTVPRIARDLQDALQASYGGQVVLSHPCLTFGSWIGGDRDGHPGVTADVTQETFVWLRREAVSFHLQVCDALIDSLSISARHVEIGPRLEQAIQAAKRRWPVLGGKLASSPPNELCRQWLAVIRWRLEKTRSGQPADDDAAYPSACELAGDVSVLQAALENIPASRYMMRELQTWRAQIDTFGLHLARLDIRQNAKVYRAVLDEIFRHTGRCQSYASLDETAKCRLLEETLSSPLPINEQEVSDAVGESLRLFRTIRQAADQYSMSAIGAHVISMTAAPSDVLAILWLWRQASSQSSDTASEDRLPIVPLLETIEDLRHGKSILTDMLAIPAYREHLRLLGDRQMIMLGYSDSTKDGGYLSACWSLHRTQQELVEIAKQHGIQLTFFHGRGGSLGRGGGPAARSILSLPEETHVGRLRLTEQGEVLADRYDDPQIAYRHLEQVVGSTLLAACAKREPDSQHWQRTMDLMSEVSGAAYRELLGDPAFITFFRSATPISDIERLPIGSRPARRKADGGLEDLRAIPWVFSWTQSRCLIPAWYGLGSAMGPLTEDESQLQHLRRMYQQWPFFRGLIDNAELALAKSDWEIASEYASLAGGDANLRRIASRIAEEYSESCRAVLALTEQDELLDGTPWLKESIRVRNRFIDPLNLIQVELLRRAQSDTLNEEDTEELQNLTRLSINGLAAGMRTSG